MLVEGKWTEDWQPVQKADEKGRFVRQVSSFRNWITPDGSAGSTGDTGFKAEAGRYHLYVAYICPWASRALMALKLKGLEDIISVSVVNPSLGAQGWEFGGYDGATEDALFGAKYMHEIYTRADKHFTGRATVPVLWDKTLNVMVNNESADILRMLDTAFEHIVPSELRLYPSEIGKEIDTLNAVIYDQLNNGVYKSGFASSQEAYDEALEGVFSTLDMLEERLKQNYLLGDYLTETDIRTFVTLIRFDAAYHGIFKCNRRQIADYPRLSAYMERILNLPTVLSTVNMDHITRGYYGIKALNPTRIRPVGPKHIEDVLARAAQ